MNTNGMLIVFGIVAMLLFYFLMPSGKNTFWILVEIAVWLLMVGVLMFLVWSVMPK